MLVAVARGTRVEAWAAEKGPAYACPNCHLEVILRKGQLVTHHFAHKPPVTCSWGKGETEAHRKAKKVLHDAMTARGLRAGVECEVLSTEGDRRADVLVWGRKGESRVAFEVQHQPLDYNTIERRTRAYAATGVRVCGRPIRSEAVGEVGARLRHGRLVVHRPGGRPSLAWGAERAPHRGSVFLLA